MNQDSTILEGTKEASIRRILLRFNDNQDKLKVVIDELNKVLMVVDKHEEVQIAVPMYMLTNSEVFRLVHSYITDKLKENTALN